MMITIVNTPELVHANGLPVRVWAGESSSGHPVLALVTRITSPTAEGTSELERELSEPPTRVVDPSGSTLSAPRWCTTCIGRGGRSPARLVARDAEGLEWYECGDHSATDNLAETTRVEAEPIGAFFDRHMLPRPSNAPPDGDAAAPGAGRVAELEARVAELASECRSLRVRLKAGAAPWLVKDFHALYVAAAQTFGPTAATPAQLAEARAWLELQLARLSPAFEHCESARSGAPERLTAAERQALDALHRWLHSPAGDCDLIESAQDYHGQIDALECERIERHEQREIARSHGLDAHVPEPDPDHDPDPDGVLVAELDALLLQREPSPNAIGAVAALAQACDESGGRCSTATPPLSDPIIVALASHPRVSDRAIDTKGRGAFLAYALRGAQMGWHARHAHPRDVALIARASGPLDEPHRSAWLTGYRIAADAPPETVAVIPIDPYDPSPMHEQAERPAVMRPVSTIPRVVLERVGGYDPALGRANVDATLETDDSKEPGGER